VLISPQPVSRVGQYHSAVGAYVACRTSTVDGEETGADSSRDYPLAMHSSGIRLHLYTGASARAHTSCRIRRFSIFC
jgi:hypothetical protein